MTAGTVEKDVGPVQATFDMRGGRRKQLFAALCRELDDLRVSVAL